MRALRLKGLRVFLTVLLVVVGVSSVSAVDWGGSISTTNTFRSVTETSEDEQFVNGENLVLYLTSDLGPDWEFVGQLGARYDSEEPLFAADVEKMYFQRNREFAPENEQPAGLVGMSTRYGRFLISEPTGRIMSHAIDGAALILNYVGFEFYAGAGYTGLINKEFSRVSMSLQDSTDQEDDDIYFGPRRLLGQLRVSIPELLLNQNVVVAFAVQEDMRDPDEVITVDTEPGNADTDDPGGLLDTQYGILAIDGSLGIPGLFYDAAYALNTGRTLSLVEDDKSDSGESYQYEPFLGHMVDGRVQYFLPRFVSSVFTVGGTFTTGDTDYTSFTEGNTKGSARQFIAVTPGSAGLVFALQPGNSTTTEVSYSAKPLEGIGVDALSSLQTEVSYYAFFRSTGKGYVSVSDVNADEDGSYLGSEVDLAVRLRPFSDFGIGLSGGVFFANDSVMVDDANSTDWIARLTASLSF
ncbi:MAG: hypothetical protein ACOC2V_03605 [Alkalispirochaeta sp.]